MENDDVKYLVENICEDIFLLGACREAYIYLEKGTKKIVDYSIEKEKIIYLDEDVEKMTLFELLFFVVNFDYIDNKKTLPAFSIFLKCLRQMKGLSQVKFAKLINVSIPTIEFWERGLKYPKLEKLINIGQQLGVEPDITFKILKNHI